MNPAEIWAIAGLALCATEMLLPGAFLLWIGLAACGAGAATALFTLGWQAQIAAFVTLALLLVAIVAARLRRRPTLDQVNAPAAGLIGGTCTALAFHGAEGRVRFRDGTWQARTPDSRQPQPGATLRVIGLDGTTLLVEHLPN